jgi:3-phenylpropionate/trans-cinnamate dioxygenase ferredoxin reductase component
LSSWERTAVTDRDVDVLIVGAGGAGSACAEALREGGFGGSVLLVGRDVDPPYDRPYCSKEFLRGEIEREQAYLGMPDDIELLVRTSVSRIDPTERTAKLSSGEVVGFGQALLAPGANVRLLRVDGCQLHGIHYLRTLGNSEAIRTAAAEAEHVVLVGGSFIATEVAASLTKLGKRCTLVMQEAIPSSLAFGEQAGRFFEGVLRDHGVELVTGDSLERFEGDDRVRRVVTTSGREVEADMVVMGTGVIPDVMLARAAGLELGESGGIVCSDALETSAEGVWAAGDVCEYDSALHGRRLRIEHWEVSRAQGRHVAAAIRGERAPYTEVPYFWSDLADWCTLEYVGPASEWDREVVRGSIADGEFTIFYVAGDRLVAALTVGRSDDLGEAGELLQSRAPVDDAALAAG